MSNVHTTAAGWRFWSGIPVCVCLLATIALLPAALHAQADADALPIVIVNGNEITQSDLEFLYLARSVKPELRDSVRKRFVEQLIDRAVLKEFLAERKIVAAKNVLDDRVARVEKLITREGLDFNETLTELGYTRATFRDEVALPLTWQTHARLAITDSAIETYWKDHRIEFDGTTVRAAQIVKRLPRDGNDESIKSLTAALNKIRQDIESGTATFAEAAAEHSDSPSGRDGGDLGEFAWRGRMPAEIARVAFGLKPGEVSEPFQTRFGLHLLTVTEVIPGDLSLEDARPEIFHHLSGELQKRLIEQLREKAEIVWVPGT